MPKRGQIWRNLKNGHLYKVDRVGQHSETQEPMVSYYRADLDPVSTEPEIWFRPLSSWNGEDRGGSPRFVLHYGE